MGRKAVSYLIHALAVLLTVVLLFAAVLSWRASYVSPEAGDFWVTLALMLPFVLLLNAGALVWWLIRGRWLLSLLPLAALLCNMGYVSAMIQLPDFWREGPGDIRVASLNTLGLRRYETKGLSTYAIARAMNRERVDILCMQEIAADSRFPADSIAALFAERMPYFVCEGSQAIASRYPILDHGYIRFPDSNNDCLWADLSVGADSVRIVSAHLQTSGITQLRNRFRKDYNRDAPVEKVLGEVERNSRIRASQVNEIRSLIDSTHMPLIVAGDFNDTPSSYTYRRMRKGLIDGFRAAGSGYGGTFRYVGGLLRIDYILCNGDFRFVRYLTLSDDVSDHKAVVAELRFKR